MPNWVDPSMEVAPCIPSVATRLLCMFAIEDLDLSDKVSLRLPWQQHFAEKHCLHCRLRGVRASAGGGRGRHCEDGEVKWEGRSDRGRGDREGEGRGRRKNKSTLLVLSFKMDLSREVVYLSRNFIPLYSIYISTVAPNSWGLPGADS